MNMREFLGFSTMLVSGAVITLTACTYEVKTPPEPKTRVVVVRGNVTTPAHCACEAAERRARAWKAYAIKLETQLGIPASSSSGGLP